MKSDIYTEQHGTEAILGEVDRIGKFCRLSPSAAGKLRLLTEEMLGLTVRLFENLKYEFYVENEERRFILNLSAETFVSSSKKEKILSLSSSGENNMASKGIFGKISGIFESLLTANGEYDPIYVPHYDSMGIATYFSLASYQNAIPKILKEEDDQWDGLERSIIATLAKDVIIGVRNNKAEMLVIIEF
ncbi:MAG: hypothetical protein FWH10_05485 [Oscillospiraceae bacterium]|nr:hypothetical protein [Oscillospiraceae bacterium]